MKNHWKASLGKLMDFLRRNSRKLELENLERNFQEKEVPVRIIKKKRLATQDKIKRYIKKFVHIIKYPIRELKTTHQKIKSMTGEDLEIFNPLNPYQMFFDWFLDIVAYGLMITIVYLWFITRNWWLVIPAMGLMRWLLLDTIQEIRRRIKGK